MKFNGDTATVYAHIATVGVCDNVIGEYGWSSKKIVDSLCKAFEESNSVAVCEPLEGYPLEVISTINAKDDGSAWDGITLTQCGKNLFDFKQPVSYVTYTAPGGGKGSRYGYSFILPAGTYTMHAECVGEVKDTYIYCILNDLKGNHLPVDGFGHMKQGTSYWTRTFTLTEPTVLYIYDGVSGHTEKVVQALFSEQNNVQIEAGSAATAYEPYRGQTIEADLTELPVTEGSYNWTTGVLVDDGGNHYQHDLDTNTFINIENEFESEGYTQPIARSIPALSGVNCLYSDCGNTQVSGREDPKSKIDKLTNAIIALGGNV